MEIIGAIIFGMGLGILTMMLVRNLKPYPELNQFVDRMREQLIANSKNDPYKYHSNEKLIRGMRQNIYKISDSLAPDLNTRAKSAIDIANYAFMYWDNTFPVYCKCGNKIDHCQKYGCILDEEERNYGNLAGS